MAGVSWSILEYASCVWSPHYAGQIQQVESVQRRFTRRLPGFAAHDYKNRLEKLCTESLELRRLRQDLIYTYKILFGLVKCSGIGFFTLTSSVHNVNTRGHLYKLYPCQSRVDVHKYFFANRIVNPWNDLPAKAEHFRSLAIFKRFIKTVD